MPTLAWCPTCETSRIITDQFTAGDQTTDGETIYTVTELSCGHTLQGEPRIYCPAPGAPYAGPERVVAATARPRDLRAADTRQRQLENPWAR